MVRSSVSLVPPHSTALTMHISESKIHNLDRASSLVEAVLDKKTPPWKKLPKGHAKLRRKLTQINDLEKHVEFIPDSAPRVLIRLTRVMGSDRVQLTRPYMERLAEKINEEDYYLWNERRQGREKSGREFFEQLAISGVIEPEPWMHDVTHHPLYRTTRIMKMLKEMTLDKVEAIPEKTKPDIVAYEPFDEYIQTGVLFGDHENHFLKTGVLQPYSVSDVTKRRRSSEATEPPTAYQVDESFPIPAEQWDSVVRNLDRGSSASAGTEENVGEGAESTMAPTPTRFGDEDEFEAGVDPFDNFTTYLTRGTLSLATRFLGLTDNDLEKRYKQQKIKLLEPIYDKETDTGVAELFEAGAAVQATLKREMLRGEEFCNKTLRQKFNAAN